MIDNPEKTGRLMRELEAALPVEARVGLQLATALQNKVPGIQPLQSCKITNLFYTGDEGGIVCHLELAGANEKEALVVSITHLMFDRQLPFARQIASYQKHRINHIRREAATKLLNFD